MLAAAASFDWMGRGGTVDECVPLAFAALESDDMFAVDNGLLWVTATVVLVAADDPRAVDLWERARAKAHERGSMFGILTVRLWRGFTLLRQGELEEAESSLLAGVEQMRLWGLSTMSYPAGFLTSTLVERGRLEQAREALETVSPPQDSSDGSMFWRLGEIQLLLAEGRGEEALAAVEVFDELADWRRNPAWFGAGSLRARALDSLGRTEEAIAAAQAELGLASAWGAPGAIGRALLTLRQDRARRRDRAPARGGGAPGALAVATGPRQGPCRARVGHEALPQAERVAGAPAAGVRARRGMRRRRPRGRHPHRAARHPAPGRAAAP